jgi:hypothetical protein
LAIYYAGIGSRETPPNVLSLFEKIGTFLSIKGCILRSGHAQGADQAFENGCDKKLGLKEIYLPWSKFEGSDSSLVVEDPKAYEIAEKFHPYWYNLKDGAKKLQARNSHQVLGQDLNTPSSFILCWTKKGKGEGGTGQAIRIARHYNIPIFDAGIYSDIKIAREGLKAFLIHQGIASENDFVKSE